MLKRSIHWFRQDLRLNDNPAFYKAAESDEVLAIYILDDVSPGPYRLGSASKWWLYHALKNLNNSLDGKLLVFQGKAEEIIPELINKYNITSICWNNCYEPWQVEQDKNIKSSLSKVEIEIFTFNGTLLWEPWEIRKGDGTPYKVFTSFYRNGCLKAASPREVLVKPKKVKLLDDKVKELSIEDLNLLPNIEWYEDFVYSLKISEKFAYKRLVEFLENGINTYKEGRNYPAKKESVSDLSPYLHFGQISPNQIWYLVKQYGDNNNIDTFCNELGWREFAYNLLYYNPELPRKNLRDKFNTFQWQNNKKNLALWKKGQTGIPFVDAGMRELWQTGKMHNRMRLITASFLTKNLLINWTLGAEWFWDCLIDADLANNYVGWQWVAGCGVDAAPYFRIFNPVSQGQKYDPKGEYTRHYVPELKNLPDKYLFNPWEAPTQVLEEAGIRLGVDYPDPIVDLKTTRERALRAYKSLRK